MGNYYQEHKEEELAKRKLHYAEHRDKILEQKKEYHLKHREERNRNGREYRKTPNGRASCLINGYNQADKKLGRGKGDLTISWVVENIFSKPCAHCGETDWHKIGCNRLDNTKPHTKDNVEPCCAKCNRSLKRK